MQALTGRAIGQYEIREEIGRGRIATVYKAHQPSLGHYVAIKFLPSFASEDPQFHPHLEEIIKTVARLDHPNITATHDFGEEGDSLYIVTQWVQGQTLEQRMGEPIGFEWTAELIRQVASALDYAHEHGVIHRALKPSNILLTRDGRPILSDFGLAEAVASSPRLTLMGISPTSPEYMPPEECLRHPIDARSDVYSLGIILYQMLTGRVPFEADNPIAIMNAHIEEKPPSPRKLNPMISKTTEKVVLKALAKRPEDRYQSAGDLSQALDKALGLLQPGEPSRKMQRVGLLDRLNDNLVLLRDRFGGVCLPLVLLTVIGIGLLLVAALGFLVWQYQMEASEERQLASLYSQGKHYMELDECDKALDQFDQILEIDPAYEDTAAQRESAQKRCAIKERCAQGLAYLQQENWKEAIGTYEGMQSEHESCPELAGRMYEAHLNYGRQLVDNGEFEQALIQFEKAVALRPDDMEAAEENKWASLYLDGKAAYDVGKWTEAVVSLGELYALQPGYHADVAAMLYQSWIESGDEHRVQRDWCEAWKAYDQAAHITTVDTDEAKQKQRDVEPLCWPPTPTPTITPTPTRAPTPTPLIKLCFVGKAVRYEDINPGLIQIEGRVLDRNGNGVPDVLIRISAWGTEIPGRTWTDGTYRIHGIVNAIPWEVDLPEVPSIAATANIEKSGQRAIVDFVEQPCP